MGALDMGWQGIGVIATAALGIYNAVRAHIDRRWVREEPTRAAQREIKTELRERYQAILDDVKEIDLTTQGGATALPDTPNVTKAYDDLRRLSPRLTPEFESTGVMADAMIMTKFEMRVHDVSTAQPRLNQPHDSQVLAARIAVLREDLPQVKKLLTERIAYYTDILDKGKTTREFWSGWRV